MSRLTREGTKGREDLLAPLFGRWRAADQGRQCPAAVHVELEWLAGGMWEPFSEEELLDERTVNLQRGEHDKERPKINISHGARSGEVPDPPYEDSWVLKMNKLRTSLGLISLLE